MANPRQQASTTPPTSNTSPIPASSMSKTESSGIGTTMFSVNQQKLVTSSSQHTIVSGNVFSPGTPSDGTSSLSSFTSTGQQMLSPESIDSVVLTMSPVEQRTGIIGRTSTFKTQNQNRKSMDLDKVSIFSGNSASNGNNNNFVESINNNNGNIRSVRPTPPSTLNLGPLRIPPAPPPRWTKPTTPNSPNESITPINDNGVSPNNFTVTTTVTFNMENGNGNQNQNAEVLSPNANTAVSKSKYFVFLWSSSNFRI